MVCKTWLLWTDTAMAKRICSAFSYLIYSKVTPVYATPLLIMPTLPSQEEARNVCLLLAFNLRHTCDPLTRGCFWNGPWSCPCWKEERLSCGEALRIQCVPLLDAIRTSHCVHPPIRSITSFQTTCTVKRNFIVWLLLVDALQTWFTRISRTVPHNKIW